MLINQQVWKTETSQQTNNSANVVEVAQKKCVSCLSWIPNTDEWIAWYYAFIT